MKLPITIMSQKANDLKLAKEYEVRFNYTTDSIVTTEDRRQKTYYEEMQYEEHLDDRVMNPYNYFCHNCQCYGVCSC
jgi:hypothetical protein